MKKIILLAALLWGSLISPVFADSQPIVLSLPESVVVDVLQKCLPFQINQTAEGLAGIISIERIDDLVFGDRSLAAAVKMSGKDVQLNTSFGSQQIRLTVGNVDLNFNISAVLRFDKKTQTLFIRPTVSGYEQQGSENNEVGKLILALFNDQDIPVAFDRLQPIITDLGSKKLIIDMAVNDVTIQPGMLTVEMLPSPSVKKKT